MVKKIYVGADKRLFDALYEQYPYLNHNRLVAIFSDKKVKINGKRSTRNDIVRSGDEIALYVTDDYLAKAAGRKEEFSPKIVFSDRNIVVFDKPQGVSFECYSQLVIPRYKYLAPVHRLDTNTGGLIVYAKNEDARIALLEAFYYRTIFKYYYAECFGQLPYGNCTYWAYLFKDARNKKVFVYDLPRVGAVRIETYFSEVERSKDGKRCIMLCRLITGRTHQIRAHLKHLGLNIVGDGKYGNGRLNASVGAKNGVQHLYASRIQFSFDVESPLYYLTGKVVEIKCPYKL